MRSFLESGDGPTVLSQTAECARIYLKDDGSVYGIGELLVQRDYARTLQRIAELGPDEFYEGETADRIAADFQRNGGLLTRQDLANYQADVASPLAGTFRDLDVLTEGVPTVGPVTVEILNVLEGYDLAGLGWNSPRYLGCLASAMHLGFRDRMELLGDPDFVDLPIERLLSKDYADDLRRQVDERLAMEPVAVGGMSPSETTHTSVMDEHGNAAAITHSLGLSSGVVTPGLGFQHNCHMIMFDPIPGRNNSIAPGKRPITGGGPVLFMRAGEPWLLIGSPAGARKVTALIQATLNLLDFGMTTQEAVAAERIHVEDEPNVIIVEPHFDPVSAWASPSSASRSASRTTPPASARSNVWRRASYEAEPTRGEAAA